MLLDIRLDGSQVELLRRAADVVGARLNPAYLGDFLPASEPRCVGLHCTSPGQLMHFSALVATAARFPAPVLVQMAVRVCEDGAGNDARRTYYWPGLVAA